MLLWYKNILHYKLFCLFSLSWFSLGSSEGGSLIKIYEIFSFVVRFVTALFRYYSFFTRETGRFFRAQTVSNAEILEMCVTRRDCRYFQLSRFSTHKNNIQSDFNSITRLSHSPLICFFLAFSLTHRPVSFLFSLPNTQLVREKYNFNFFLFFCKISVRFSVLYYRKLSFIISLGLNSRCFATLVFDFMHFAKFFQLFCQLFWGFREKST